MQSAIENEWVEDCARRRRYFTGVSKLDKGQQAAARHQASNSRFGDDYISLAGINMYRFRYHTEAGRRAQFKIVLPVHDAFIVEVHKDHLKETIEIIKIAMGTLCQIPGTGRHLGVDVDVFKRWGEDLDEIPELAEAA